MIEFNQLEQLVTISKAKTISKAAEILLISQPALTRSIQRLEEDLNIQLFDRTKNKVILNENGKLAVMYAEKLLASKQKMIEDLKKFDQNNKSIHISSIAPAPIWALTYIFKNQNSNIQVTSTLETDEDHLFKELNEENTNIIVLNHPVHHKGYICIELFEEHLYLSVPPAHPLAMYKKISFSDIDGQSVLLFSHIGFWNEITQKMLPNSHLLYQEDRSTLNELTKMSALPTFKSNITMTKDENNRIYIPIQDDLAHNHYYAIYLIKHKKQYQKLKEQIQTLDLECIN